MNFEYIVPKKKWNITFKLIPFLVVIFLLKLLFHYLNWEVISLNALFTSLIAATTFLIGFLITGVISDYKESEKLPGDLAASLETIYDEAYMLQKNKKDKVVKDFLVFHKEFVDSINEWFYRKERTKSIINKIHSMNDYFAQFESITQPNFLTRMKNEQANVRKMVIRIDNIRDLSFIQSAYAVVETLGFFIIVGLLVLRLDRFYESAFFTLLVSFVVLYMIFLIRDLDNPFEYSERGEKGTEVSLKPLHDLSARLKEREY